MKLKASLMKKEYAQVYEFSRAFLGDSFTCYNKKRSSSCLNFRFLDYLVSGCWLSKQYEVYVPSLGVGLKSNQMSAGYSLKVYATIALARFAGRIY